MTQRSPLNERNQLREGGKTRKSAASAKPVSKAAASVYIKDPNAKAKSGFFDSFNKKEEEPAKKKSAATKNAQAGEGAEGSTGAGRGVKGAGKGKKKGPVTVNDLAGTSQLESTEGFSKEDKKSVLKSFLSPGGSEYKKWRTIWWACIVGGIITLTPPLVMPDIFVNNEELSMGIFGVGWAFLLAAITIDAIKIRPLRKRSHDKSVKNRSKAATRARKAAKKEAQAKQGK